MTTTEQATSKATPFQLFPTLDAATDAALRESISRFGVLVPVAKDQHGRTLDGHQRSRIAAELGVDYRVDIHVCANDDEAREIAHTLNADRRQMNADQRRQVVAALRKQGHSLRAIAGAVGASLGTVQRDVAGVSVDTPGESLGKDGKRYKAKRTVVAAKSKREADRAHDALASLEQLPANVIDVKRAERLAREQEAATRRSTPVDAIVHAGDITIMHGDFRDVLVAESHTYAGATVITDPPYPREYLPLWHDLAQHALGWGCDTIVAMSGQFLLPDVIAQIASARDPHTGDAWTYRWCGAYMTAGPSTRVHVPMVGSSWKPILIFDAVAQRRFVNSDVFHSTGDDKRNHYWGQNADGIASLVEAFTKPGDLVIDPFLGGGTTAIVCKELGRRFVGCDIDAAAIHATLERLSA